MHNATVCPVGFRASFAALFVLNCRLRKYPCLQSLLAFNFGVIQKQPMLLSSKSALQEWKKYFDF